MSSSSNHHHHHDDAVTAATDVVPLLLLIYGILSVAALFGIVTFVQQQRTKKRLAASTSDSGPNKVRDTVNNKEIKTTYDNLLSIYDKKMMELNAHVSTGSVLNPDDIQYVISQLQPHSTIWDVLCVCLTTPTTMEWSVTDYNRVHVLRQQRKEQDELDETIRKQKMNTTDATTTTGSSSSTNKTEQNVDVFDDLFNNDVGWDNEEEDDDDDDDDGANSKQSKNAKSGSKSTGSSTSTTATTNTAHAHPNIQKTPLLEGLDANVLGQQWVEKALQEIHVWPPKDLGLLQHTTFEYNDPLTESTTLFPHSLANRPKITTTTAAPSIATTKQCCQIMDHPALRRTLCMIIARFNSIVLNNHSELIDAGLKQLIDQTYFKSSMEFRNRMNMILETTVQLAILLQSYPLLCTILSTITTFKIGIQYDDEAKTIPYFNTIMTRQYNILPRLKINASTIRPSNNSDGTANDNEYDILTTTSTMYLKDDEHDNNNDTPSSTAEIILDVERIHAQQFLKVKVQQYEQQNIPPQIGLQNYRERWWFMLRMKQQPPPKKKNSSSNETNATTPSSTNDDTAKTRKSSSLYPPITVPTEAKFTIPSSVQDMFESQCETDRLLTAWPLTITNIAQQRGQVKIQFQIPKVVGKYTYYLHIHSSDFLGAHQDVEFHMNVVSRPTTATVSQTEENNEEAKKEK